MNIYVLLFFNERSFRTSLFANIRILRLIKNTNIFNLRAKESNSLHFNIKRGKVRLFFHRGGRFPNGVVARRRGASCRKGRAASPGGAAGGKGRSGKVAAAPEGGRSRHPGGKTCYFVYFSGAWKNTWRCNPDCMPMELKFLAHEFPIPWACDPSRLPRLRQQPVCQIDEVRRKRFGRGGYLLSFFHFLRKGRASGKRLRRSGSASRYGQTEAGKRRRASGSGRPGWPGARFPAPLPAGYLVRPGTAPALPLQPVFLRATSHMPFK